MLYTPSPSSSSSSTSSNEKIIPSQQPAPASLDDSEMWASIRLASSPPTTQRPTKPLAATATPTTTLAIDDFSQDRMGRVPPSAKSSSSVWPLRRAKTLAEDKSGAPPPPPPQPSAFPFTRAQSLPPAPRDTTETMDARVFVTRDQWVPHKDRRSCVVCDREFGLAVLRKKHSCRMCGDVVCSRCSLFKSVRVPGVGESRARVCARCVVEYRQRIHQLPPSSKPTGSTTTLTAIESPAPSPLPILEDPGDHHDDGDDDDDADAHEGHDAYSSCDELPSVEDVLRRTAAKVASGGHTPFVFVRQPHVHSSCRPHKPVSLLSPDLLESMHRESVCLARAHQGQGIHNEEGEDGDDLDEYDHDSVRLSQSRPPSMVLLSPGTAHELQLPLFDLDRMPSFSSTISTLTSSTSSSSSSLRLEEELAAAAKARELEKEVAASRDRIAELERRMAEQATTVSMEQQAQLAEARALIATLQQQLRQQEQQAKDAALARDSISLANSIQRAKRSASIESSGENEALRRQLRMLERQLQHAGLSAAEHIPYAVAKQRVAELARRMSEISDHESQLKNQPHTKQAVTALRREYFALEQEMERYHTALLLSDEYLEEQRAAERSWEDKNAAANAAALRTVRAALPVAIAQLSEAALRRVATPSGRPLSADLARRFKRTNILQLVRVAPTTLIKMHPSVVENYRTTGLALLERRALHAALQQPMAAWAIEAGASGAASNNNNMLSGKKHAWARKLRDAFAQALSAFDQHMAQHHADGRVDSATCPFIGKMCVVWAEKAVEQLYANAQLGFPEGDVYAEQDIVRSSEGGERGGAGGGARGAERMLPCVDEQVQAEMTRRQRLLKQHYKNVRQVTMALASMEELDSAMDRLRRMDEDAMMLMDEAESGGATEVEEERRWEAMVTEAKDTLSELARRAGICLSGKRDPSKDALDTRSLLEATAARDAVAYITSLVEDLSQRLVSPRWRSMLGRVRELLADAKRKNDALLTIATRPRALTPVVEDEGGGTIRQRRRSSIQVVVEQAEDEPIVRVRWSERSSPKTSDCSRPSSLSAAPCSPLPPSSSLPPSPAIPRSSILLDAIRMKRSERSSVREHEPVVATSVIPEAGTKQEERTTPEEPTAEEAVMLAYQAQKPTDLLAAIRARKARAAAA